MNPLTNMKNVQKLSERELYNTSKSSWHDQYKDSAWIFVGGLPYDLTEGDIICIFSQYGEVVNINLIRAKDTGKSKGFCFLCYEDQRSTILAVDNFNGIRILNRIIRVDHVQEYKVPKEGKKTDDETKKLYSEGCAPKAVPTIPKVPKIERPPVDVRETIADQIEGELKLPARLPIYTSVKSEKVSDTEESELKNNEKKKKKKKKSKKKKSRKSDDSDSDDSSSSSDSGSDHKSLRLKKDGSRDKSTKSKGKSRDEKKRRMFSPKRKDRSRSREKEEEDKPKTFYRGVSPSIPKRWR